MTYKKALITDVDNTLFDWFSLWHASFSAMLDKTLEISGVDRNTLLAEMRVVFQKHHTSEYSFVLEECPSLVAIYGKNIRTCLNSAIEAYRKARESKLLLYPSVESTLNTLKNNGIQIVAYTESLQYYTVARLEALNIHHLLDALYSPPDSENIHLQNRTKTVLAPLLRKELTPLGALKPSPEILLSIIHDLNLSPEEVIYVGDSEFKDIAMANDAQVESVWAKYGTPHFEERREDYRLLQTVSHWPEAYIQKEITTKSGLSRPEPQHTISAFSEILPFFGATS